MLVRKNKLRGDTLIEVLFATAAFSLLAVGAIALMNQGLATSQRALEITLVRNEIDSQAEALRFLNTSYIASYNASNSYATGTPASEWYSISETARITTNISEFGPSGGTCPEPPTSSFILNPKKAKFLSSSALTLKSSETFSQLVYDNIDDVIDARGIWIEAIRSIDSPVDAESNAGYIDFHIRACWFSPGQNMPMTIGTIVRLYEPR